jgi:hypothetical protein
MAKYEVTMESGWIVRADASSIEEATTRASKHCRTEKAVEARKCDEIDLKEHWVFEIPMSSPHFQQPPKSKTCGQHCIAMLAGVTPQEVISKTGIKGATTIAELMKIAGAFGMQPASKLWMVRDFEELPPNAMLKLKRPGLKKNWHWACVVNGEIHDPSQSEPGRLANRYSIVAVMPMKKGE